MAGTTPPTEAEIREKLEEHDRRWIHDRIATGVSEAVDQAFTIITYTVLDEQGREDFGTDALTETWAELSPRDQAELADVVELAKARAREAALEAIRREVVVAALAFGSSHPHAARVAREGAPA